jgi:hypothetical protein
MPAVGRNACKSNFVSSSCPLVTLWGLEEKHGGYHALSDAGMCVCIKNYSGKQKPHIQQ